LVIAADAGDARPTYGHCAPISSHRRREMYVAVLHRFQDPQTAFERGQKLVMNEDAPPGVHGLQFYPATDGSMAACLWESDSVETVQVYVDSTLGDSSVNTCWEVDVANAFAEQPLGLQTPAAIRG
jgi:hypothetical protein